MIPFLGYHHYLMILIAIAIILLCTSPLPPPTTLKRSPTRRTHPANALPTALLLAGCSSSSPLIPGIYLINLVYAPYPPTYDPAQVNPGITSALATLVGRAQLEARVGYFGVCISLDGASYLCSNNASSLAAQVAVDQDPLNLIWVASTFKDSIVFPYLLIVAVILSFFAFLLLATFPAWHNDSSGEERKALPSRPLSQVTLAIVFVAAVFVLVSVLWQHTASVAASTIVQDLGNGSVKSGVGVTAMVLGWFGFALLLIVAIGTLVMVLSRNRVADAAEVAGIETESGESDS